MAHAPLVRSIARRYRRSGLAFEDLESEGVLGLLEAAQRFDPGRGTTFGAYATSWVRVYVQRYAMGNRRIVPTPQTRAMRRIGQIRRVERELEQQRGEQVDADAIARILRLQPEQVQEARDILSRRDVTLRHGANPGATIRSRTPSPEDEAADHELQHDREDMAARALAQLDRREREIIEGRLLHEDRATLESLGHRFGITRERVRQIESRALGKMRRVLRPPEAGVLAGASTRGDGRRAADARVG